MINHPEDRCRPMDDTYDTTLRLTGCIFVFAAVRAPQQHRLIPVAEQSRWLVLVGLSELKQTAKSHSIPVVRSRTRP